MATLSRSEILALREAAKAVAADKAAKVADRADSRLVAMGEYLDSKNCQGALEVYRAVEAMNADERRGLEFPERTIFDIITKSMNYGGFPTDKQVEFIAKLVAQIADRDAPKVPAPISNVRQTVTGKILRTMVFNGYAYGSPSVTKILIRHADGWTAFGSLPGNLYGEAGEGDTISFVAKLVEGDRGAKFERPAKATVVSKG
jgi:hypothetical protein